MVTETLITGMEGMTGSHLARALLRQGRNVIGTRYPSANTSNISDLLEDGRVNIYPVDLTDRSDVVNLLASIRPGNIFHLAGKTNNARSWEDDTLLGNIQMTQYLLGELKGLKSKPRFVFASTVNVYGPNTNGLPFSETAPFNPDTPYALSKQTQEELRIIYCFKSQKTICLLHGFKKQTQKTPQKELEVALQRMKMLTNV